MQHARYGTALAAFVLANETAGRALPAPETIRLAATSGRIAAYVTPAAGGELGGLEVKLRGQWLELLYGGRDYRPTKGWPGRAPLLWPATGRTFVGDTSEQGWLLSGKRYAMPIHGFARSLPWTLLKHDRDRGTVSLRLTDNAQTREAYPFGFSMTCAYAIRRAALTIRYAVTASRENSAVMPFSIGNHITFRTPLVPGGDPGGVTVVSPANRRIAIDSFGRPTGAVANDARFHSPTPLSLLESGVSYSLNGYRGAPWAKLTDPAGLAITIKHWADRLPSGAPVLFNLWGDTKAGYFSPEPWVGKQNSLATGDGTIHLQPGETFRWTVKIAVQPRGRSR